MAKLELHYPCKPFKVTQGFGENATPIYKQLGLKGHNGIDIVAPDSWIIRASHEGTVVFAGEDGSGGLGVVIRTLGEFDYTPTITSYFKTIYWHLKTGSIFVKPSQNVKTGDIIALADNTGLSTGSHLHFGLKPVYQGEKEWEWWNVEQDNGFKGSIDPQAYFTGFYAEDSVKIFDLKEKIKQATVLTQKLVEGFNKIFKKTKWN